MIILGLIFLLIWLVLPLQPFWLIGWILIAVGLVLALLGAVGRPVGPRRWYY